MVLYHICMRIDERGCNNNNNYFFLSSRRRHTRSLCDWSSDVCSSDLMVVVAVRRMADVQQDVLEDLAAHRDARHGRMEHVHAQEALVRALEVRGGAHGPPHGSADLGLQLARDRVLALAGARAVLKLNFLNQPATSSIYDDHLQEILASSDAMKKNRMTSTDIFSVAASGSSLLINMAKFGVLQLLKVGRPITPQVKVSFQEEESAKKKTTLTLQRRQSTYELIDARSSGS